ncbi:MAG: guanylate kinase [Elusimicrobium sp.]|jgi:guanylate kinase|nr:guanylate kinase [Elusimicrobium sp.]
MGNFVLVISSPSGGGKTTIINELLKRRKDVKRVVTATTRAPRQGEKNGRDYLFWTAGNFESAVKQGAMAEWAKVFSDYYGTPKAGLESLLKKNIIPVLNIDVQGAKTIKKLYKNSVLVFIMPPSWAELKKRLLARRGGTNDINLRLKTAKKEAAQIKHYDYLLINDKLEQAVTDLSDILTAEKLKVKRSKNNVNRKRI